MQRLLHRRKTPSVRGTEVGANTTWLPAALSVIGLTIAIYCAAISGGPPPDEFAMMAVFP
jgi:hypothetical protein